jgi:hypothetical protein
MTPDEAREWLPVVMHVPPLWAIAMVIVAVVSAVDLSRAPNGDLAFHVGVDAVAIGAIALIWLPALLRLLSLTGGSLKAAGVEASAGGLLSPDDLIDTLASIRTRTEQVGNGSREAADQDDVARNVNAEVSRIAEKYLPPDEAINETGLDAIAKRYEEIRRTQPRGHDRTIAMTRCVNEARVRAKAAPASARERALRLLASGSDGDRIVGLALTQEAPDAAAFQHVLRCFTGSASSFEAYHALVAMRTLAPLLSSQQRGEASAAIEHEKTDPRGKRIMQDPSLPGLIEDTLKALSKPDRAVQVAADARSTATMRSSDT